MTLGVAVVGSLVSVSLRSAQATSTLPLASRAGWWPPGWVRRGMCYCSALWRPSSWAQVGATHRRVFNPEFLEGNAAR